MNNQNVEIIADLYAAFQRADIDFILSKLVDDVRWISHFDPTVPWDGDFSGTDRVPAFFAAIFDSVDVEAFEPKEWISEGDSVVSVGEFACKVRTTGKRSRTRWVFIWKFREGKISSFEQFHDPAIAAAFR
ncbi:MAG TPA: nuclear transport factor 2 family protein [Terrimicrobiaceae bacterium]